MAIIHREIHPYLNYFLCLEADIHGLSRWIEFSPENENVYSIELARLLMTAAAETDVIAKALCKSISSGCRARTINEYQAVLCKAFPILPEAEVEMPRHGMSFHPWLNWRQAGSPPDWWQANNKVKHHRAEHFKQASLKNVLNAGAGLLVMLLLYHRSLGNYHFSPLNLFVPKTFGALYEGIFFIGTHGANVPWERTSVPTPAERKGIE